MSLAIIVFESVAVLLILGILGFWSIHRKILEGSVLNMLSPLVIDLALPCLIFVNVIQNFNPDQYTSWWTLPLWWLFFTSISLIMSLMSMYLSKHSIRREFFACMFLQNGIFFPLIILQRVFNQEPLYVMELFFFTIFYPPFFFNVISLIFRNSNLKSQQPTRLLNPLLVVTITAMIIKFVHFEQFIPDFIISSLRLVGQMSIPILFLIIGGNIYLDYQRKEKLLTGEIIKFVLVKNFVFPLVVIYILSLIQPPTNISFLILLQAAAPPLTFVPIAIERANGNRIVANQFFVASFLLSIISLPLSVLLANHVLNLY